MNTLIDSVAAFLDRPGVRELIWALALFVATAVCAKIAAKTLRHLLQRDSTPLPNASIFINITRGVVWLLGGSIILDSCFGINASAILAALGVGGIAVSLGFQDTLANLIGGLQVTFMGIVKPGDNIEVGAESGVVQDIGWRHTTIKDGLGQTVVIPNSIISKTALVHLLPATRVAVPFAVGICGNAGDGAAARDRDRDLDALDAVLRDTVRNAVEPICPIADGPTVFFSEITELGIRGKVILSVTDASCVTAATDATVRAVARELG